MDSTGGQGGDGRAGKGFSTLAVAVTIFGLGGSAVAAALPTVYADGASVSPFPVFLSMGVAAVALTALLFAFVARLGLGFGTSALALAAGYNVSIAVAKLALSPTALYEANRRGRGFRTEAISQNDPAFYVVVGVVALLLYLLVFGVMYRVFRRRHLSRSAARSEGGAGGRFAVIVIAVVVALIAAFTLWFPLLVGGLSFLNYLEYVLTGVGVVILLALVVAAALAWSAFDRVEKRAADLGDATLLAGFFWFGLSLIVLYHAMWAIFLIALVNIWPFRTYTPK